MRVSREQIISSAGFDVQARIRAGDTKIVARRPTCVDLAAIRPCRIRVFQAACGN